MVGCSVRGCKSRSERDSVKFYAIPALRDNVPLVSKAKYQKRRSIWLSRLGKSGLMFEDTKMKVCSLHFISGKPSKPLDVDNPDWAPSLHTEPESHSTLSASVNEDPVSGQDSNIQPDDLLQHAHTLVHLSEQEPSSTTQNSTHTLNSGSACGGPVNSTFSDVSVEESHESSCAANQDIVDVSFKSSPIKNQSTNNESSLKDKDLKFQELQLENSQLLKSRVKLRDQLTEAEVDKLELSKSISELEERCESYELRNVSLEARLREFNDEIKAKDDRIKELEEQLGVTANRANTLEEKLKNVQSCVITLDRLKNDGDLLKFYTGLNTYEMFNVILSHITSHTTDTTRSLESWQGLLLTLMRLRLGLPLQDLAYRFGTSVGTAGNVFEKWLYWLSGSADL